VSLDDESLSLRGARRRARRPVEDRDGERWNAGLRATLRRALVAVRSGDRVRAEALLEAALDNTR
jgi:hypothetical protein